MIFEYHVIATTSLSSVPRLTTIPAIPHVTGLIAQSRWSFVSGERVSALTLTLIPPQSLLLLLRKVLLFSIHFMPLALALVRLCKILYRRPRRV